MYTLGGVERGLFLERRIMMGGLTAHTLYILGGGVEAVGGPEDPEEEDIEKGG